MQAFTRKEDAHFLQLIKWKLNSPQLIISIEECLFNSNPCEAQRAMINDDLILESKHKIIRIL